MKRSQASKKPFFIQLSWHALHAPENALRSTIAKYERIQENSRQRIPQTAAIAEDLDTGVGMVMDAIDRLGLAKNTFVIYMSDNGGGGGKRGQLNGGKGAVYEGGIRSPMIVRGPGVAANSCCHEQVVGYDLFPTFCEWAGVPSSRLPRGLEGGSIASMLENEGRGSVKRSREGLVFHFPHYQSADGPQSAIIVGDLKLMKFYDDDRLALFNIANDIQERVDLSQEQPKDVTRLHGMLKQYLSDVGAKLPVPNPDFDPDNVPSLQRPGPQRRPQQRPGRPGQKPNLKPGKKPKPRRPGAKPNKRPRPQR